MWQIELLFNAVYDISQVSLRVNVLWKDSCRYGANGLFYD